jgi:hypothetical protein
MATRRDIRDGTLAGILAAFAIVVTLFGIVLVSSLLVGCSPQPGPQFAVHEVGGEGFVEGAAWGTPFEFAVQASGIADADGELVDCVVVFIKWEPYLDVAGVPYDAPPACIDEYGALPGFFRDHPGKSGESAAPRPDT